MPSAKKDGKKKKKSKKELEQERLLLEEQKRKEEEAQRFAELTKQREKELIELKEREERDEYLEKQSEVHEQERFQLQDMSRIAEEEVHRLTKEIESKEEWEQYCACSPLPFIQSEPEVAAFLTVFQTIHEKQSFDQLRHALVEMEPLVQGLEKEYGKSMDQGQFILAQRYAKNLLTLYSMVQRKIDAMTAYILQNPEQFPREPSENLLLVQELHTHCHYCLWVNYTKNPRHKSFDIRDVHIALPKTLTLSNVAIRVVVDRSDLAMTTTYLREGVAAASSSSSSSPSPTSTPIPTLSRQTVVSGVIVLSLLDVPDPPKTIDFWTLRPLLSNQLITRPVEYPFQKKMVDRHHHPNDLEDPRQRPESKEPSEVHEDDAIHVSFTLGAGLFIHPLATVKWWNEEVQQWESQGISEVEIDRSKGMVHFKTTMFKPCALVQV
ncbi:Protein casc1 [Coelomomyces lativittatus]|nr:Protein casc1 [Coelomomyces lativittatus]